MLAPLAGVAVDRFDRRRIMLVTDVVRGLAVGRGAAAGGVRVQPQLPAVAQGLRPVGTAASGALADRFTAFAVVAVAGIAIAVANLYGLTVPSLRRIEAGAAATEAP